MTKAYGCEKLRSLVRRAEIKEASVIITDSFEISERVAVTERFVSRRKAVAKQGELIFGETVFRYPADKVCLSITEEKHTPHEYDKEDEIVYCYDFLLKEDVTEISFEIITE